MLNIMTFNIRYGTAADGDNHWQARKDLVIERIRAFGPDLLGLQECRDDEQAEFIRRSLPEYRMFAIQRGGDSSTALEMAPILFRRSAFEVIQSGFFWLSPTPGMVGSKSRASAFPRTTIWAALRHKASGQALVFLNTHFDYQPRAINGSARQLQKWAIGALLRYPLIVSGDFNTDKHSAAYRMLTAPLVDAYRQIHPPGPAEATFHDFGRATTSTPIDWILVSPHFTVLDAAIDKSASGGHYPSDHYPLTSMLTLIA
jgi:endonuclease/exonuclease/phosphatase family metal-dependent hydrolase